MVLFFQLEYDFLCENLLDGSGDYSTLVLLDLFVSGDGDLIGPPDGRAGEFVDIPFIFD